MVLSLIKSSFTEFPSPDPISFSVCEINFRLFGGFDTASWKNENFKHFPVTPSHIPDRQLHVFLQSIP